jgi:F0F1-type ATP synthase membrane subunit b/b'
MISDLQRQLGIDASFFYQLAIFIFIFIWLRIVFFAPYLKLIQRRENQSDGLLDDVQKLDVDSARLEQEREASLVAARKKAFAHRDSVLVQARKEANDTVSRARDEAKSKLDKSRELAQKSAESELSNLKTQVGGLSTMLVEKLTKTRVGL